MFLDRRLTRRPADAGDKGLSSVEAQAEGYATEHCWLLEFAFRNEQLAAPSPVAEIVDALHDAGLPASARQDVHTLLNELYVNALDYGVLGLDSSQKSKADGFDAFHSLREQQLERLRAVGPDAHHWIKVNCVLNIADRPILDITVADSGSGAIATRIAEDAADDTEQLSQRGLKIVGALADDIQFSGKRNQIRVSYRC